MITSGPFTVSAGVILTVPNPLAQGGNPPKQAQLQNGSGYTLTVMADGVPVTIAAWTAQTVTLDGSGSPLTVEAGTLGQGGATNELTVVWLLAGETAPMADGPLTAAAVAAEVAGSVTSLPPAAVQLGGSPYTFGPAGAFSVTFTWPAGQTSFQAMALFYQGGTSDASGVTVRGVDTGVVYLRNAQLGPGSYLEVPVNPVADPGGVIVSGTWQPPMGPGSVLAAYGITGTAIVRMVNANGAQGPDSYVAAATTSAFAQVLLIAGSGPTTLARIWSVYMSGYIGAAGATIEVVQGYPIIYAYAAGGSGFPVNINQQYAGGLPIPLENTALYLTTGAAFTGSVAVGVAYSLDIP